MGGYFSSVELKMGVRTVPTYESVRLWEVVKVGFY